MNKGVIILITIFLFSHCGGKRERVLPEDDKKVNAQALFTLLSPKDTKLNFINVINESPTVNGVLYEYLYNGGGVAVGDLNNDGLPDIYFISNLYSNKLFINKGNLVFEETTLISGVKGAKGFPTGVTLVDINNDGLLDIYVCKSGDYADLNYRRNELFINEGNNENGIPVFKEGAASYNLDLPHYSTQAAFFDYDRDGDLDMFLLNHGIDPGAVEPDIKTLLHKKSEYSSEKLFRNDNGKFKDVSGTAGLVNNAIGFGLGIAIGDLNNDQWPDIVVGQDYSEKDHLYINQQNGTFKEVIKESTNHISNASMGNDIGDINNDGWLDFVSLDMASNNNYDLKTSMSGMNPERFESLVNMGLHHQYMVNTLQLNNGNLLDDNIPAFSEIGQLAGLSNTNWSWAPLLMDMNNDGWQDIFVSNGIVRAFRNNDFVTYKRTRVTRLYEELEIYKNRDSLIKTYYEDILNVMPEKKEVNMLFLNNKDFTFSSMHETWNLEVPTCSNGAAYADLDNDGDLDIVTNNINDAAFVYRNNTRESGSNNNYLKVKLSGPPGNIHGIGSRIAIEADGSKQIRELYLSRGFQSAVDNVLHFGIGDLASIPKLLVLWPDGKSQSVSNVKANQQITLYYDKSSDQTGPVQDKKSILFKEGTGEAGIAYQHEENLFDNFERESLLPHKLSQSGPAVAVGDVNNDGLDDFYVGGAKGQASALFVQQEDGKFESALKSLWIADKKHEDVAAAFFDADNDGNLDLYVVSGGNEEPEHHEYYQDRFYKNLGNGMFIKVPNALPELRESGSCVVPGDFDKDGDMDLFIGGKLIPGKYPLPASSHLLKNESEGQAIKFTDVTDQLAPFMTNLGMVSDAQWVDIDNDENLDLAIVGEWMPVKLIKNTGQGFADLTPESDLANHTGWWFSIASADFDKDGDADFIVGNLGLNYKYKASAAAPFEVYTDDFDNNGNLDIVLAYHENGTVFPLRGRECSSNQMPFIKEKFPSYNDFGLAGMKEVFGIEKLEKSLHYAATTFATSYIENLGDFKFSIHPIKGITQFSSVNSILIDDFNGDNNLDVVLAGNLYQSEIETPRNDAGYGVFLRGNGKGQFTSPGPDESGLFVKGDVKNAAILSGTAKGKKYIIFGKNDDHLQVVQY